MARLFSIRPSITFRGRKFMGIRGWSGKPLHPPLTDFPIVSYVLAATFDLISFIAWSVGSGTSHSAYYSFIAATWVLIAGAIVSLGTALTGFWDWWKGLDRDRSTGPIGRAQHSQAWRTANWHMTVMLTVTAVVVIDIIVRLATYSHHYATLPVLILSIIAGLLVFFGSFYGGSLVFEYQFNVESLKGSTVWDETEEDQLPGQKDGA
jgi:uncharacterized membrane protein